MGAGNGDETTLMNLVWQLIRCEIRYCNMEHKQDRPMNFSAEDSEAVNHQEGKPWFCPLGFWHGMDWTHPVLQSTNIYMHKVSKAAKSSSSKLGQVWKLLLGFNLIIIFYVYFLAQPLTSWWRAQKHCLLQCKGSTHPSASSCAKSGCLLQSFSPWPASFLSSL